MSRTFFPIKVSEQWAYDLYKKAYQSIWTPDEITYFDDKINYPNLNKDTQHFIKHVLAFFASSDALVNDNLAVRFYKEFDSPVIQAFYAIQIGIEQIHSHTYADQIEAIITSNTEKDKIFNSVETMPVIGKMSQHIASFTNSNESISRRLIGMMCVEGIMFSSSFCAIYYLKKNGKMPGLAMANELIARDEGLHAEMATELYKRGYVNKLTDEEIKEIVHKCVELTCEFACEALPVALIGMSNESMIEYIKSVADYWVNKLGHAPFYNSRNPFNWMVMISLENKSNFFERRVSEYSKITKQGNEIKIVEDF